MQIIMTNEATDYLRFQRSNDRLTRMAQSMGQDAKSYKKNENHKYMNTRQQFEIVPIYSRGFLIQVSEYVTNERQTQSFVVNMNRHAYQRSIERKIGREEIAAAIIYGYSENKQGECFYALTHSMLPIGLDIEFRRSDGLVVICDESSGFVKTCYRKKNPIIHVKKKRKYRNGKVAHMKNEECNVFDIESYKESFPDISFYSSRMLA